MKKKIALGLTALILVVGLTIGGTLAYMQAKTETITNTFTVGSVKLVLNEDYAPNTKLVPGTDFVKKPVLTVKGGSEESYVRAKVEIPAKLQTLINAGKIKIDFNTADWGTRDADGYVYYKSTVVSNAADTVLPALFTKVTVDKTVTNEDLETIAAEANRQIMVTGYAIQKATFGTKELAWAAFAA